ncbi:MFS transporter [Rhodobacteraceae bacterium NNCM2]|nr:MFS transporter [Coraliihabitans acroporae]
MRTLISFAALFLSVFLVQMGSGSLGPLDVLAGSVRGFTDSEIGFLGSAHFMGFFIGCWMAPRYVGRIGHSRSFAAAAAIGAMGALLHPVLDGPLWWAGLRVLTGIAIASAYTVTESWLQAKTENANRGRVYGVFRVVDMGGAIAAQGMIAVLDPASYAAYNIVAVFCCLCLLPLTISRRVAPELPGAPRLRPLQAYMLSPLAAVGIVVAGLAGSAFRMVGPLFGLENGLNQAQIAIFLSVSMIGGILVQYPIGWLADKFERRMVLIFISLAAVGSCLWTIQVSSSPMLLYLSAALFGVTSYPVYSISSALANDRATPEMVLELNASLIFFYSLGAVISPTLSAYLINEYGPSALFVFIAASHLALIVFALYRMTRRETVEPITPYSYIPRTSMVVARMFGRTPDPDSVARPRAAQDTETERTPE